MNWFQKISWRGKHQKDKKNIYLWHISPDRHNVLKPRSRMGKEDYSYTGLYFTPSFKSLLQDWMSYISGKKVKREDRHSNDPNYAYETLFIHKVSVPEWVLKESYKRQKQTFNIEDARGEASFGFWGWGQQVFIPEDLLNHVSIIDIKNYSYDELQDKYVDQQRHRDSVVRNFNDPNWFISSKPTREEIIQFKKDEAKRRSQITVQDEERKRKESQEPNIK